MQPKRSKTKNSAVHRSELSVTGNGTSLSIRKSVQRVLYAAVVGLGGALDSGASLEAHTLNASLYAPHTATSMLNLNPYAPQVHC